MRIYVTMKDGTTRKFEEETRSGGSYTNSLRSEGVFLVVTDLWDNETWIPAADVERVETKPGGGW